MKRLDRLKRNFDRAGIRPNARLGQNFLLDANQVRFIARQAELDARDVVLEVGPGTGFLSREILAAGATLVAVEYDRKLYEYVSRELAPRRRRRPDAYTATPAVVAPDDDESDDDGDGDGRADIAPSEASASREPEAPADEGDGDASADQDGEGSSGENREALLAAMTAATRRFTAPLDPDDPESPPIDATLLRADILAGKNAINPMALETVRAAWARRGGANGGGRLKCVSNLPYSAGTPFAMNLFVSDLPWERAVFLIQYEVAEKMVAEPGADAYGGLAITVALGGAAKIVRRVPPPVFWPRPRVDSAVVSVTFRPPAERLALPWRSLRTLTSAAFCGRRKRLANAFKGLLPRETVNDWLAAENLDPETRAQTLTPEQFLALARLPRE